MSTDSPPKTVYPEASVDELLSHLTQALEIADRSDWPPLIGARIQQAISDCVDELLSPQA
jgi:hypothetical protein